MNQKLIAGINKLLLSLPDGALSGSHSWQDADATYSVNATLSGNAVNISSSVTPKQKPAQPTMAPIGTNQSQQQKA